MWVGMKLNNLPHSCSKAVWLNIKKNIIRPFKK